MTTEALAKVPQVQIVLAINETELEETKAEVEIEALDLDDVTVEDDDEAELVLDRVRYWLTRYDALEALRVEIVTPINEKKQIVQDLFNPVLKPIKSLADSYKAKVNTYQLAQSNAKAAAFAAAAAAAAESKPVEMRAALTIAQQSGPAKVAGTSTTFAWRVKKIVAEMLPNTGDNWVPNLAKFEAIAKATDGSAEPPPTPGVVYEKVASTAVRRKGAK